MDGSGTTTAAKELAGRIYDADKEHIVLLTREPTKRKYGLQIRNMLANPQMDVEKTGDTLTRLFVSDRFDHTDNVVMPALSQGLVVVQDRGMYSTIVYQGLQGVPHKKIVELHTCMPARPDAVLIFNVSLEDALKRVNLRKDAKEAFDQESFLTRTCSAYRQLPDILRRAGISHPRYIIDANRSISEVVDQCMKAIDNLLPYKRNKP